MSTMQEYFTRTGCTFAFAAEDATAAISKVSYDTLSNSFVGFNTPFARGIPPTGPYQTDSYRQLQNWFEDEQKSCLINTHMIQPLRSAYEIDGSYTAEDVLNPWL